MQRVTAAVLLSLSLLSSPRASAATSELDLAIHSAARYLERATLESGQFVYRVNLDPEVIVSPRYNILRHAGAIVALATYDDAMGPEATTRDAARRAAEWMLRETLAPMREGEESPQAIWSVPEIDHTGLPRQAKLGGAGLALIALVKLQQSGVMPVSIETLRALGDFVLKMQRRDGSFYSKYVPSEPDPFSSWNSLYYPGEAALGLLYLQRIDPHPRWLMAAARALKFLVDKRKSQSVDEVEADHWALLATREILPHAEEISKVLTLAELSAHARKIIAGMLADLEDPDARTTPIATRLEGLLAVYPMMSREDPSLAREMSAAIDRGIAFLIRAQVKSGPHRGGIPRSVDTFHGLDDRATEIRIDYVQHAISAFMDYRALRSRGPEVAKSRPRIKEP